MSSIASGTTTTTGLVYTSDTTGNLVLQTNGTTTAVTIDTSQNVLIGTTTLGTTNAYFQNTTNARTVLNIGSNTTSSVALIYFTNPNGGVGTISTSGTATAYNTSSDSRLKTLIGVATDASLIDDIVVNDFTWKVDGTTDRGVFAQDAQKIKPTAIHPGETEELNESGLPIHPWGVDYSKFVPDLIVYCQQLKKIGRAHV